MTTPKYRVRQVAHDDDVQGSSMGGLQYIVKIIL